MKSRTLYWIEPKKFIPQSFTPISISFRSFRKEMKEKTLVPSSKISITNKSLKRISENRKKKKCTILITLSGRSTTDALIRAGNTSTLRPGRRSAPPGRRTSVGSTAPTVLLPVHFVPLPGARGRHRLQHLLHAGESRGADRGRPRLPA